MALTGEAFLTIGVVLLLSLLADWGAKALRLPRISLLLLLGVLIGTSGLNLLPPGSTAWSEPLAQFALLLVAFLLGGELKQDRIASGAQGLIVYSLTVVAMTSLTVGIGLWLIGAPPVVALLLSGVAAATDPATVSAVARETGRRDRRTHLLLGIVAIDDAWGLLLFGVILACAGWIAGTDGIGLAAIALRELAGGILVGLVVGTPAAYLTGLVRPGEPSRAEAIGVVLVAGGLAIVLEVSHLLAAMVAGVTIANLARHHVRSFREIEHFEWPFLVVFFVFAGASFDFGRLLASGLLGFGYIALRTAGRIGGGMAAAALLGDRPCEGARVGAALTPQAGVALGMALIAAERFPEVAETIIAVTVAATVLFELFGPVTTRWAMLSKRASTTKRGGSTPRH